MKKKLRGLSRILSAFAVAGALCLSPAGSEAADVQPSSSRVSEAAQQTQWKDIAYGNASKAQTLDLYLPTKGKGPFPLIVFFHDRKGDKGDMEGSAQQIMCLSKGYAVACVNYREVPEARFPADVSDAKAAVRFLKANGSKYGVDTSHVAAWGESHGGRLASFVGVSANHMELEDLSSGGQGQSSRVNAVVAWFPLLNEVSMDMDFKRLGIRPLFYRNEESYGAEMYGAPIQSIPGLVAFSDPTRYISPEAVPFFIVHGTADNVCPISQSEHFAERLRHTIGSKNVTFLSVTGGRHRAADFYGSEDVMKQVFRFLDKRLKVKNPKSKKK